MDINSISAANSDQIVKDSTKIASVKQDAPKIKQVDIFGKDQNFLPIPEKLHITGKCPIPEKDIIDVLFKGEGKRLVDETLTVIEKGDKYESALAMKKFHTELNSLSLLSLKEARKHLLDLLEQKHDEKNGRIMRALFDSVEQELAQRKGEFHHHPAPLPFPIPRPWPPGLPTPPQFPPRPDFPPCLIKKEPSIEDIANYLY